MGGYGLINEIPAPSGCTYSIAAVESTGTFGSVTENMIEDVRLAARGKRRVHFYGRPGGGVPTPEEIEKEALKLL